MFFQIATQQPFVVMIRMVRRPLSVCHLWSPGFISVQLCVSEFLSSGAKKWTLAVFVVIQAGREGSVTVIVSSACGYTTE